MTDIKKSNGEDTTTETIQTHNNDEQEQFKQNQNKKSSIKKTTIKMEPSSNALLLQKKQQGKLKAMKKESPNTTGKTTIELSIKKGDKGLGNKKKVHSSRIENNNNNSSSSSSLPFGSLVSSFSLSSDPSSSPSPSLKKERSSSRSNHSSSSSSSSSSLNTSLNSLTSLSNTERKKLSQSTKGAGGSAKSLINCDSTSNSRSLKELNASKLSSRNWSFTVHNAEPKTDDPRKWIPANYINNLVYQYEKAPTSGNIHIQGTINFTTVFTFSRVVQFLPPSTVYCANPKFDSSRKETKLNPSRIPKPGKVFWKICQGSFQSNAAYCLKKESQLQPSDSSISSSSSFHPIGSNPSSSSDPPLLSGSFSRKPKSHQEVISTDPTTGLQRYYYNTQQQGKRTDIDLVKEYIDKNPRCTIQDVASSFFKVFLRYDTKLQTYISLKCAKRNWKTEVTLCYGVPQTGKSRFSAMIASHYGTKPYYVKDGSKWFDNYDGYSDIVFDDFYGSVPFHALLTFLDRYPCQVERKGAFTEFAPYRIFITSNQWYLNWYRQSNSALSVSAIRMKMQALYRRLDNILIFTPDGRVSIYKGKIPTVENFQIMHNEKLSASQQSFMIHPDARFAKEGQVVSLFREPIHLGSGSNNATMDRNASSASASQQNKHNNATASSLGYDEDPAFPDDFQPSEVNDKDPFFMLRHSSFLSKNKTIDRLLDDDISSSPDTTNLLFSQKRTPKKPVACNPNAQKYAFDEEYGKVDDDDFIHLLIDDTYPSSCSDEPSQRKSCLEKTKNAIVYRPDLIPGQSEKKKEESLDSLFSDREDFTSIKKRKGSLSPVISQSSHIASSNNNNNNNRLSSQQQQQLSLSPSSSSTMLSSYSPLLDSSSFRRKSYYQKHVKPHHREQQQQQQNQTMSKEDYEDYCDSQSNRYKNDKKRRRLIQVDDIEEDEYLLYSSNSEAENNSDFHSSDKEFLNDEESSTSDSQNDSDQNNRKNEKERASADLLLGKRNRQTFNQNSNALLYSQSQIFNSSSPTTTTINHELGFPHPLPSKKKKPVPVLKQQQQQSSASNSYRRRNKPEEDDNDNNSAERVSQTTFTQRDSYSMYDEDYNSEEEDNDFDNEEIYEEEKEEERYDEGNSRMKDSQESNIKNNNSRDSRDSSPRGVNPNAERKTQTNASFSKMQISSSQNNNNNNSRLSFNPVTSFVPQRGHNHYRDGNNFRPSPRNSHPDDFPSSPSSSSHLLTPLKKQRLTQSSCFQASLPGFASGGDPLNRNQQKGQRQRDEFSSDEEYYYEGEEGEIEYNDDDDDEGVYDEFEEQ